KTACRYRNMSCTNVEPFIVIHDIQKVHKVRKVIKRLPDSHDHNMADTLTISFIVKMFLYIHDLLDNFSARQVTAFLYKTSFTICTAYIVANLFSYTNIYTVVKKH